MIGARNKRKNKTTKKKKPTTKKVAQTKQPKMIMPKPSKEIKKTVQEMKAKLLRKIEDLGDRLPPNTLDQLVDELGGPTEVAEVIIIKKVFSLKMYTSNANIT